MMLNETHPQVKFDWNSIEPTILNEGITDASAS